MDVGKLYADSIYLRLLKKKAYLPGVRAPVSFKLIKKYKSKAALFLNIKKFVRSTGKLSKYALKTSTRTSRVVRFRYIHFRYNVRSRLKLRKIHIALKFLAKQV